MKNIMFSLAFQLYLIDSASQKTNVNWYETKDCVPQHLFNNAELVAPLLNEVNYKFVEELTKGL